MANDLRSQKISAGIVLGIGMGATFFGLWRVVDEGTLVNGSLWAGLACLVISAAMIRRGQGGWLRRTLLLVAELALVMSLYSTYEQGRRHGRARASPNASQ